MAMVNTVDQWVKEITRFRGGEEPSVLDLVFTKKTEHSPNIGYHSPMGKSDHVVLEIELKDWETLKSKEEHKKERLNYSKANFDGLSNFFGNIRWKSIMEGRTVQEKYGIFLEKYKEGVQNYVPLLKLRE